MGGPCLPWAVSTASGTHLQPTRHFKAYRCPRRSAPRQRHPAHLPVPFGHWMGKMKPRAQATSPNPTAWEGWQTGFSVLGLVLPQEEPGSPQVAAVLSAGDTRLGLSCQTRGTADGQGAACAPCPQLGNTPAGEQGQIPGCNGPPGIPVPPGWGGSSGPLCPALRHSGRCTVCPPGLPGSSRQCLDTPGMCSQGPLGPRLCSSRSWAEVLALAAGRPRQSQAPERSVQLGERQSSPLDADFSL